MRIYLYRCPYPLPCIGNPLSQCIRARMAHHCCHQCLRHFFVTGCWAAVSGKGECRKASHQRHLGLGGHTSKPYWSCCCTGAPHAVRLPGWLDCCLAEIQINVRMMRSQPKFTEWFQELSVLLLCIMEGRNTRATTLTIVAKISSECGATCTAWRTPY